MATALVANPTGYDLADLIGRSGDTDWIDGLGSTIAALAREAASSYTHGVGFEDPEQVPASLRWVILLRAARLASNYQQLVTQGVDSAQMNYGLGAVGWTLYEQTALDDYRVIAC